MNQIEQLTLRIATLEDLIYKLIKSDRYVFERDLELSNGRNIILNTSTGTRIGTATTQKIALYGVTPVVQASAISSPSGGATIDSQARAAIDSIRTAIKNIGITA